jgi:hypothetical protein
LAKLYSVSEASAGLVKRKFELLMLAFFTVILGIVL